MTSDFIKTSSKAELLAPAGSKESFYAAINAGADAVYMAASKFGARAYADNFTDDDIFECSEIAHIYGKKIYLTVNTLLKDDEFEDLEKMLDSGILDASDGLIVQDMGVAEFIKNNAPHIPLHASTQMSVSGVNGVRFLLDYGFSRIVPARELSLDNIREIYEKTGAEIECFIHGSMCYSYSGQCLFSSILGSRSGNRGRCAQPCRLPYSLKGGDGKEHYPLSLKDMCTLNILPEIIDAGAVSLKVEGRMKPPSYVSGVIGVYRKYLDLLYSGDEYRVDKKDMDLLKSLYVRDSFSEGYYKTKNSRKMITFDTHGYNQDSGSKSGTDTEQPASDNNLKKFKVSFNAEFLKGRKAVLIANTKDIYGNTVISKTEGEPVEEALSSSVKREDIAKSLKKLGNTVFETDDKLLDISVDENIFYSLKGINELRRRVLDDLKEKIKVKSAINNDSFSFKNENFCRKYYYKNVTNQENAQNSILLSNLKQARALAEFLESDNSGSIKKVYLSEDILDIDTLKIFENIKNDIEFYAALSFIRRSEKVSDIITGLLKQKKLSGVLVRNLEDLSYFTSCDFRKDISIISDFSIYAFNYHSASFYDKICDCMTLPLEISYSEEMNLKKNTGIRFEKVYYGHAPLMITANCVRNTFASCTKAGGYETLIDRKNTEFPVKTDCMQCINIIYNSVPLMIKKDNRDTNMRVELTVEDYKKSLEVIRYYFGDGIYPGFDHTFGWQTRPVI